MDLVQNKYLQSIPGPEKCIVWPLKSYLRQRWTFFILLDTFTNTLMKNVLAKECIPRMSKYRMILLDCLAILFWSCSSWQEETKLGNCPTYWGEVFLKNLVTLYRLILHLVSKNGCECPHSLSPAVLLLLVYDFYYLQTNAVTISCSQAADVCYQGAYCFTNAVFPLTVKGDALQTGS